MVSSYVKDLVSGRLSSDQSRDLLRLVIRFLVSDRCGLE